MRTLPYATAIALATALNALSATNVEQAGVMYAKTNPGKLYADSGLSLRTPDFHQGDWGYFVGVGYQVSKYWAGDFRIAHQGLDAEGSAVQDIGGRLVARMPFEYLAPYTFLGGSFDLERDRWHLEPGIGIELGAKIRVFGEIGLDSTLLSRRLDTGYKLSAGFRIRF